MYVLFYICGSYLPLTTECAAYVTHTYEADIIDKDAVNFELAPALSR